MLHISNTNSKIVTTNNHWEQDKTIKEISKTQQQTGNEDKKGISQSLSQSDGSFAPTNDLWESPDASILWGCQHAHPAFMLFSHQKLVTRGSLCAAGININCHTCKCLQRFISPGTHTVPVLYGFCISTHQSFHSKKNWSGSCSFRIWWEPQNLFIWRDRLGFTWGDAEASLRRRPGPNCSCQIEIITL